MGPLPNFKIKYIKSKTVTQIVINKVMLVILIKTFKKIGKTVCEVTLCGAESKINHVRVINSQVQKRMIESATN